MSYSGLVAEVRRSNQRSSRLGVEVDRILLHGFASTDFWGTVNLMTSGRKQVSANYVVSNEGYIVGIVDEEERAWTSGSSSDGGKGAAWDRRSITIEIENETGAPEWQFSEKALEAVARLIADIAKRRRKVQLLRIEGVLGHRELWALYKASYPTACPQSFNMDGAVNRGRAHLGQGPAAPVNPGGGAPAGGSVDYGFGLTKVAQLEVQKGLARLGRYKGDQDGIFGALSVAAFQRWLIDNGLLDGSYAVDGIPGPKYGTAVQVLAQRHGYKGPLDGAPGTETSAAIEAWARTLAPAVQQVEQRPEGRDWSYWEPRGDLAARVQRALADRNNKFGGPERYAGKVDGEFGPLTRQGVQLTLQIAGLYDGPVDGEIARVGSYAIQEYAKRFGGYTGPVDGAPREASWLGFAKGLEVR